MTPALPAPAAPVPVSQVRTDSIVVRIGYYTLLVWTFLYFSRLLDVSFNNLKIMMILNLIWLGAAFLSGGIISLITTRAGIAFTAFFCWVVLVLPFSVWKGGSVETVKLTLRALLLMGSIIALVRTTRDCRRLMYTMGFALAVAAVISRFVGEKTVTGRLVLASGTFSDPNFYCMALLIGLPFVLLRASIEKGMFSKIIAFAAIVPLLLTAVATGSRSGLVALVVMFTVYFIRASGRTRIYLIAGATASVLLISIVASDFILKRFTTLFNSSYDESLSASENRNLSGAAVASSQGRKYLLLRSIELTLQNPIVGVGPGMFAVAEAADAKEQQLEETWHETHNTYTQISSETGIPGLIFYAAALIISFRSVSRLSKLRPATGPDRNEYYLVRQSALYLQLSFCTLLAGATFLSIAYSGLFFYIVGLCVALEFGVKQELLGTQPAQRIRAPSVQPAPVRSKTPFPSKTFRPRSAPGRFGAV